MKKHMVHLSIAATTALLLVVAAIPAAADAPPETCDVAQPLDGQRLLRRISLDLRGYTPSYDEAQQQRGQSDVPSSLIDQFLHADEFRGVMRHFHEGQLWPNIDQVSLVPDTHMLYAADLMPGLTVYYSPLRAVFMRTAGGSNLFVPCKPEPARFDAMGNVIADPVMMGNMVIAYQEGYVEVEPYWAPGTTIKVCGFDAQASASGPVCPGPASRYPFLDPTCQQFQQYADALHVPFEGSSMACDSFLGAFLSPACGCGPNLKLCHTMDTLATLRSSLLEQELRIIDRVIVNDQPYHDILRTKSFDVNGPVAHYFTYQSRLNYDLYGAQDPTSPIPQGLAFTDKDKWIAVDRTGKHSGILTTPGYLLRFQSNRARAHRFYEAFECSAFIPSGPLPAPSEPCSKHEDLTKRCGCNACHTTLEPMASHWGRFAEYGISPIDDVQYPEIFGGACAQPFSSLEQAFRCFRFYKMTAVGEEVPYQYQLNAYVFRTPDQIVNIDQGPVHLAQQSIDSGAFATCTARKLWAYFMRRQPTSDEDTSVIPALVKQYEASNFNLRTMVNQIVAHAAYRRLP
jgi:hypothetical protein